MEAHALGHSIQVYKTHTTVTAQDQYAPDHIAYSRYTQVLYSAHTQRALIQPILKAILGSL